MGTPTMARYAVAVGLMLVSKARTLEARTLEELRGKLRDIMCPGNVWDLSQFTVEDSSIQIVPVLISNQETSDTTSEVTSAA